MFHRKEKISRRIYMEERIIKDINNLLTQLFQKMHEAGYEWDAEKLELKKIEQKPAWSEEDEKILNSVIEEIMPFGECPDYPTDEDREYYYSRAKMIDWLKSLRPQNTWKPSEEQMKALWEAYKGGEEQAALASLYSDLKKLREE
jgi:hypothetical protein